ncbi:hypothetical protein H0H92_011285 [Tricholoma furcatifolium]|nr:hypothetical protein H0H92_011285 [Tricholoma furcatifolium]
MLWFKTLGSLLLCSHVVHGSLVDDIINAIEDATNCAACHALLVPLKELAEIGDSTFSDALIEVCKIVGVSFYDSKPFSHYSCRNQAEDDDVCAGTIAQQAPIIAHDLRSISDFDQTATKLCDSVMGLCQPPVVNPYTVSFPKPAPTNPKVWVSTGRPPFQVSHFSDAHIDREYTPGTEANCTKPICCRDYADSSKPPSVPAGPIGAHNCDTSSTLAHSLLEVIPASNAFSIFTGDVVEAAVWLVNQSAYLVSIELMATPTGNHEVAPVNLYPRSTASTPDSAQWVYDTQSQGWKTWINSTAANEVANVSGCYSIVHPGTSLRIISINTGYWYKDNFWLYDSDNQQPDPNGIFAFLVQELQLAEDAGQRAWIIGHMPPGGPDTLHDQCRLRHLLPTGLVMQSNYFDQIVQRYKNTIAAQFYGHSHQDQFEIAYSAYENQTEANAVSMAWIAPSLTPRTGNPAFKMYDIDPETYEVMNAYVYFADMASPTFQIAPKWELYYSSRATWGSLVNAKDTEPLGPAFWHRVTEIFKTNTTAFQQYNTFLDRGYNVPTCDTDCQNLTICGLRAQRAQNNCQVSKPGVDFRKRNEGSSEVVRSTGTSHRCEGTGLGSILSRFPALVSDPALNVTVLKEAIENVIANRPSTPSDSQTRLRIGERRTKLT